MKFIKISTLFLFDYYLLVFIVYLNSAEVSDHSEQQSRNGHLTNYRSMNNTNNVVTETYEPSPIITLFKRSTQCVTRRYGNRYRRICRKAHRYFPTRFENTFNKPIFYGKPASSPYNVFNQYRHGYRGRNNYRYSLLTGTKYRSSCHHSQNFYCRQHKSNRPRRPSHRPVRPTSPENGQPNREYCGMRSYDPLGGRVVGGRPAEEKEFPWQVGLQEDEGDNNYQIRGGGVILNKRWVLTAAHVFQGKTSANDFRGVIGVIDLNSKGRYLKFDKLIKHHNYKDEPNDFNDFYNDIALLHTTEDIPLYPQDESINNICLPNSQDEFKGSVTVTGWGKTSEQGLETNQLMTVDITVLESEVCDRNFKKYFNERIMICAGNLRGGKDSCSGDSGGPLIKRMLDKRWYLVGVVSFGGYQKCARKGTGASYTKVSRYISWILKHIKQ